eukprot:3710705-Rhodomonas_salina.5
MITHLLTQVRSVRTTPWHSMALTHPDSMQAWLLTPPDSILTQRRDSVSAFAGAAAAAGCRFGGVRAGAVLLARRGADGVWHSGRALAGPCAPRAPSRRRLPLPPALAPHRRQPLRGLRRPRCHRRRAPPRPRLRLPLRGQTSSSNNNTTPTSRLSSSVTCRLTSGAGAVVASLQRARGGRSMGAAGDAAALPVRHRRLRLRVADHAPRRPLPRHRPHSGRSRSRLAPPCISVRAASLWKPV